jgi:cysteine-rich repeat protein
MLRFNALLLLLWCAVGGGCSTDIPPDAIESSAFAVGAAGQVASASNTIERECGPGARQPQCPRPEVCELARHARIGHCRNPVMSAPHCGNGIVEAGEGCDDGNQSDADGCSSTCQKDDDAATPGDDRAGYVSCGSLTCGPGQRCCGLTWRCVSEPNCGIPTQLGNTCDGQEDCSAGQLCLVSTKSGHFCAAAQSGGGREKACHTAADCVGAICGETTTLCSACIQNSSDGSGSCSSS